jgi:RNA polymerase sigma-70 factor (ECF subfamily)
LTGSRNRDRGRQAKRSAIAAELPRLRRYARALVGDPVTADDLVQDTLLRALDRIDQWRRGDNPRPWLFRILYRLHLDGHRKRKRQPALQSLDQQPELIPGQAPRQIDGLLLRDLDAALQALPAERRHALLLVGLEGLSYRDAAAVMEAPLGTLMSRLARGREELRQTLEANKDRPVELRSGE